MPLWNFPNQSKPTNFPPAAEVNVLMNTSYGPLPGRADIYSTSMQLTNPFPANYDGPGDALLSEALQLRVLNVINKQRSASQFVHPAAIANDMQSVNELKSLRFRHAV